MAKDSASMQTGPNSDAERNFVRLGIDPFWMPECLPADFERRQRILLYGGSILLPHPAAQPAASLAMLREKVNRVRVEGGALAKTDPRRTFSCPG